MGDQCVMEGAVLNVTAAGRPCQYGRRRKYTMPAPTPRPSRPSVTPTSIPTSIPTSTPTAEPTVKLPPNNDTLFDFISGATWVEHSTLTIIMVWASVLL